ncbi:MAG: HlyD family type I secretion periplasmic adaptor subunit [Alphaproteobacteria bacterium]|nr:HlyD family type I secretion periplasmic adaptor subunit [Alphaproteobacteria bacterium]
MDRQLSRHRRSIRHLIRAATAVAVLLLGSMGVWAVGTDIYGAVMAQGTLEVGSNVKKIQHPTGGVIKEIKVHDGDTVQAGDTLVLLDDTATRASLGVITSALDELAIRQARLKAERDSAEAISFPQDILSRMSDPEIAATAANEKKLFDSRRSSRLGQKAQLTERVEQLKKQINGMSEQIQAKAKEETFVKRELENMRTLWEQHLVQLTRLTSLERDAVRLESDRATLATSIAEAKGKIAENELQAIQIDRDLSSEVTKDLREIDGKLGELIERKAVAEDQMRRIEIKAQQGGIIHQLSVHTVGGVISAGEVLMLIVPDKESLVVDAKLNPKDIDQAYLGQPVMLRFSALNQRTTPEIAGHLSEISADITKDQRTDATYYTVQATIEPDQIARLGATKLVPGMPVEVFIQTRARTAASYLVKPLSDQIKRAFREQ